MFILEDGEVFGDQTECQDTRREDPNGYGNFREGWEVFDIAHEGWEVEQRIGMFNREPTDIKAVEDHANEQDDRTGEQTIGAGAILFDGEPYDRSKHANNDLCPE